MVSEMKKKMVKLTAILDIAEEKLSEFEDIEVENQNQSAQRNKKFRGTWLA